MSRYLPAEVAPVAVAGLPAQPVFTGREAELRLLAETLRPGPGPAVITIAGLGGVGKTALAVCAAASADDAGWFPGGVLMANIQAYQEAADGTVASSVLAGLLNAAGVPDDHIPPGLENRVRRWRSVLADRADQGHRMLLVIDNATRAEQVEPVLPGAKSHGRHRVLVTSRHSLSALQGAQRIELGVLSADEAVAFLAADLEAARADHGRIRALPKAGLSVAKLCAYLPLALRISSGLLVDDPHRSVGELAELLRSETDRLEELNLDGTLAVRATFDVSYRNLSQEQARVFRLFSINPGPVAGTEAVAALTDLPARTAGRVLRRLAHAHIIDSLGAGRWRMHDLVRLYATELCQSQEEEAAGERLVGYYLRMARAAERHLDPRGMTARDATFADRRAALAWLDAERSNLVGAVTLANTVGDQVRTVGLAAALHCYLELRRRWQEGVATAKEAQSAARRLRDREAEWIALANLGHAYRDGQLHDRASECHRQALAICRETGNHAGEAFNLSALGNACAALDRPDEAVAHNEESLRIRRELGDRYGQRITLNHLGNALRWAGRIDDAIECYLESLQIREEMGDPLGEGRTLTNLGTAYHDQGRIGDAIECYLRDLAIARELEDLPAEAFTLTKLGHAYRDSGQGNDARDCYQRALKIGEGLMDAPAVRDLTARLDSFDDWIPFPPPQENGRGSDGYAVHADCAIPCYDVVHGQVGEQRTEALPPPVD